ncbi:MAG: DUF1587 domain-containing protein, partial [Planctomycetes bacterium]|nr:DUF1587 domain-containing protein [Planctomycetota bacterium]
MSRILTWFVWSCGACWLGSFGCAPLAAQQAPKTQPEALERSFRDQIQPVLREHCYSCHGPDKAEAKLDLARFRSTQDIVGEFRTWEFVAERLVAKEMPPSTEGKQPTAAQREAIVKWVRDLADLESQRNAGDPGPVLARRLSNAEYNRSIRDLTGVDLQPTREFPVDPANEAGFDNSGESLTMSPALLKKYLEAARFVADHLVLKPNGFAFAPYPVVAETDRDNYCVHRIVDFYKRHQIDYADYFYAAWRYRHRTASGSPSATLAEAASTGNLSPNYLNLVWTPLHEEHAESGPMAEVVRAWRALPDESTNTEASRRGCEAMRELVLRLRQA